MNKEDKKRNCAEISDVGERVLRVIKDNGLKKREFAKSLGVSENYIILITTGRQRTISESLAKLIETLYRLPDGWILSGAGDVHARGVRDDIADKLKTLDDYDLRLVAAYMESLSELKKGKVSRLSKAERQVYDLYAKGYDIKQTAAELRLSVNTIKTHSRRIYKKLGLISRKELLEVFGETGEAAARQATGEYNPD